MNKTNKTHPTTYLEMPEAVGVFSDRKTLQAALYDLLMSGFRRDEISILGDKAAMDEKLGSAYWQAKELEDNPDAPRAAFVSEEAIGELEGAIVGGFFFLGSAIAMTAMLTPLSTLAASIAAIAVGGGPAAVIGALMARRVGQQHNEYYARQIRNGGILLWVRTRDKEQEELAVKILRGHSGNDVHVHGWSE